MSASAFRPFEMERWQSTYENVVDYNLSESGVHPLTLGELLDIAGGGTGREILLGYGQSNGSIALRRNIARLYRQADVDNICVTNGSAEANFIALWALAGTGDDVAILTPTYGQTPGLARSGGVRVHEIPLRESDDWQPDPDDIRRAVRKGVRVVVVTNPGNPTAAVLTAASRAALVSAADEAGAWILADEVYTGAEREGGEGEETASFWGEYPRVIATGSLSKAYGLPGLRIGWVVAPADLATRLWARKDYTTISPGDLTDHLARLALEPGVRPRILERTRSLIRAGWRTTQEWMDAQGCFVCRPPEAGAICYARYDLPIDSLALAERLRTEQSVLIVPGAHFEQDRYVRLGFGLPPDRLEQALERFGQVVGQLVAA